MSARRQAMADRPDRAGEARDDGSGRGAQAGQGAGLTRAAPGAEPARAADATKPAPAGARPKPGGQEAPEAGGGGPRAGRARARQGAAPGGRAKPATGPEPDQSGNAAETRPARPARPARKPLPTRVPASKRRGARPATRRGQEPEADGNEPRSAGQPADDRAVSLAAAGQLASPGLPVRLMALARMIQIGSARSGRDGFSNKLLADAEEVLSRAGERMRLSSSHTVVALAGGTGSGKSSLFNRLAGAEFSTVGVTRPVTRDAHACIWGATGSGALVDWLGVARRCRYSRASALDRGEADLAGLVLLDLPDHDSVVSHAGDAVDRLVRLADVLIWVLDPQKYADAAVHRGFLVPMASHADVVAVVLNQADLLDDGQVDDCVTDLRRLLDSENLPDVPILVTSAVTGAGMDELRTLLVEAVAARVAATVRISADVDGIVSRFAPYAGDAGAPAPVVPEASVDSLAARFEDAAGVQAVRDTLRGARELRAADFVGWPVAWLAQRLTGRGTLRKIRLGMLWDDLHAVSAGPAGTQQAEIDNALTEIGDKVAASMPKPWSDTVRSAARCRADAIPAAIGAAIAEALPARDDVPWWWRLAGAWQGLLLGAGAVAIGWLALITVFGVLHVYSGAPGLFTDAGPLPWVAACAVVVFGIGAATSRACLSLVRRTAENERADVTAGIKERIAAIATEMVVMPAEQELSEFERFRDEVRIAGQGTAAALTT